MIPVDYLDRMTDEKADLKTYCQNAAHELIDTNKDESLMLDTRPYIKKYNLTRDKAQWSCWQVQMRVEEPDPYGHDGENSKNEKDIYVTAVRRKYIPPLMECY